MNTSPPETCTWSNLIRGIKRVDPKTVKSDTVAREASPSISSLYVPISYSKKSGISTASLPPSLIGSRRERPWTDIQDPTASLPVHKGS